MGRREKLCLQMRNKNGQDGESYCRHYLKNKGLYIRQTFFSYQPVGLFIMCLVITLVSVFVKPGAELIDILIPIILVSVAGFFYFGIIFYRLWYWKYAKHVFVTDEGIWIMYCKNGGQDFAGKQRLFAPRWSLYSWSELKSVSKNNNVKSVSKIANFFEAFDNFVVKSSKYTTLYMKRWDGVERIDFLKNSDAEEILEYMKTQKKARRKKVKEDAEEIIGI